MRACEHREAGGGGTHQLQEARVQNLENVYGKWLDEVKGTPEDPKAVRSRLVATHVNTYAREDVTQATPPIKVSRIIVSQAAKQTNAKGQHDCLIARHDIRVARYVVQHRERPGCSTTRQIRGRCMCTRTRIGQQTSTCLTAASRSNRWFHCFPERQSLTALSGPWRRRSKPQIGMQSEVTSASDSSAARGICTRMGSGKVRLLSIKELWIQESYRKKEFQLVSVDTLLNLADIGTKAHTSERLTSLLRQMPLRLGEVQKQALACLVKSNENLRPRPRRRWRRLRRMVRSRRVRWMP